ncbi:unnamed protein product [Urochloa decumbens]|uniref:AAA+ ATPase domain-containing protein n=1 Tax=Urochloa decumbens TaxID=240449 RepID=A0ABC8VIV5_9POAL
MEIAARALSSLLPKLGTLLSEEFKLQKGVRGEIMFLKAELEIIQASLEKVSRLPAHQVEDLVKIWARDVKELSYDIEDQIEAFMVDVDARAFAEPQGFRHFIETSISLLTRAKTRRRIAIEFKDIKSRVHQVAERRKRYRFQDVVIVAQPEVVAAARSYTSVIDPRLLALYEDVARLVGIERPSEKLINLITQGEQRLKVVSIVGVGGLGKTTLANSVYQRLKEQFQCHALVSVSLKPDIRNILSSILRQISKKDAGEKEPHELIDEIRRFLMNKRYLFVIDDVWDKSAWKFIKCALIENGLGSRVIVTTRNLDVAKLSGSFVHGTIFELEPLSDADSKRLFYRRIFNNEDGCPPELKEISGKILKRCGGLPLAVVTVASLLANKLATMHEWCTVYNYMGSRHEEDGIENMRRILSLSYYDLPSHLRPCLLYLSMYPEDYEIKRHHLVQRWVAEGFIDVKPGRTLYELGVGYFNELVNRSLIQPIRVDANGSAEACRVHDVIHDLVIFLSTEENFVTRSEGLHLTSSSNKIRRLYIQNFKNGDNKLPEILNTGHVRSLALFGRGIYCIRTLSEFPVLRTLDLNDLYSCRFEILKDATSLRHLRYLPLRFRGEFGRKIVIPNEVGHLRLLKILDLRETDLEELPESIVQLRQLECLLLPRWVRMPDGISNMRYLQELSYLDIGQSPNAMYELQSIAELRILDICAIQLNKSYAQPLLQCLHDLGTQNLHSLQLFSHMEYAIDYMSDSWWVPGHLRSFRAIGCQFSQLCQGGFAHCTSSPAYPSS